MIDTAIPFPQMAGSIRSVSWDWFFIAWVWTWFFSSSVSPTQINTHLRYAQVSCHWRSTELYGRGVKALEKMGSLHFVHLGVMQSNRSSTINPTVYGRERMPLSNQTCLLPVIMIFTRQFPLGNVCSLWSEHVRILNFHSLVTGTHDGLYDNNSTKPALVYTQSEERAL